MSSSDFLNEMHVGGCLALKLETLPVSTEPQSKGGRAIRSHEIQGGEKSDDWGERGQAFVFSDNVHL